ncbi:MAG TPA: glycosyltransferase family 2 protein, partial [Candidatus Latescibacteria bacterium]|nr:glycosyltransferase family 2 protein [Candidatus Latescibacterota bacterium]
YTVASLKVLQTLDLDKIYKRYGMPNDMLVKLNVYDFRVKDVHVKPVYNVGEKSGIRIRKVLFTIPLLLFRLFLYRMVQKYVIRNTHPLVLFYLLGGFMLLIDIPLALRLVYRWALNASVTVENVSAVLFCAFMGFQSILFAMLFDMEANKDLQGK